MPSNLLADLESWKRIISVKSFGAMLSFALKLIWTNPENKNHPTQKQKCRDNR
jgi:hypothetical protein